MHETVRTEISQICKRLTAYELCGMDGGCVSTYNRQCGVIFITAFRTDFDSITTEQVLAVLPDGSLLEGNGELPPLFEAHKAIYQVIPTVNAIISADPPYTSAFAQTGRAIRPYGYTHASHFCDQIPCTRKLTPNEIAKDCEKNIGQLVARSLLDMDDDENIDTAFGVPSTDAKTLNTVGVVLCCSQEVWSVGKTAEEAMKRMYAAERTAKTALYTELLMKNTGGTRMQEDLLCHIYRQNQK